MAEVSLASENSLPEDNYVLNILNHINELNDSSLIKELECYQQAKHLDNNRHDEGSCEVDWDSLLCWPETTPGTLLKLPCFDQLYGIKYDSSR